MEKRVKKEFYCLKENKTYKVGDIYKGNRKDIDYLLEDLKPEVKEDLKPEVKENKKRKIKLETK